MIFLGHLGIGNALLRPLRSGLPRVWILVGTIAPDLLDKSLYYGQVLFTGKHGLELGLVSGTRTFGHTAVLLVLLVFVGFLFKVRCLAAFSLGIATHLVLDGLSDYFVTVTGHAQPRSALLWPWSGLQFPVIPYQSVGEHLASWNQNFLIFSESLGLALLGWDHWRLKTESALRKARGDRSSGVSD